MKDQLHNALREAVIAKLAYARAMAELAQAAGAYNRGPGALQGMAVKLLCERAELLADVLEDGRDVTAINAQVLRGELDSILKGQ